jgi:P27 family predicted phage terminase small subunit
VKLSKEAKIIKGTFRKNREQAPTVEFTELERMPDPPSDLGKAARKLWQDLGKQLVASKVMTVVDIPAFGLLCDAFNRADLIQDALTKGGKISIAQATADTENAVLIRQLRYEREFVKKLLEKFGATPVSRNSVSPASSKKLDPDSAKILQLIRGEK